MDDLGNGMYPIRSATLKVLLFMSLYVHAGGGLGGDVGESFSLGAELLIAWYSAMSSSLSSILIGGRLIIFCKQNHYHRLDFFSKNFLGLMDRCGSEL